MDDWKNIETAPKDGTIVLAAWWTHDRGWYVYPVVWRPSKMYAHLSGWHVSSWPDLNLQLAINPMFWTPLPPPPELPSPQQQEMK
jgi:hypothetical protein